MPLACLQLEGDSCRIAEGSHVTLFHAGRMLLVRGLVLAILAPPLARALSPDWIVPSSPNAPLIWGRKDGTLFGLPSEGGMPGPRGLLRVGVVSPETGKPQLLNFIAIEPVVFGPGTRFSRMAFSELEPSQLDEGHRGKRMWVVEDGTGGGRIEQIGTGYARVERLSVRIEVERFTANGAHVYLIASMDSDRPHELDITVYQHDDSPPIEELTLTATMGNFERLRYLYLKNRTVASRALYAGYTGDDFIDRENYPLEEMLRTADGDAIALCKTDEAVPSSAPDAGEKFWHYPLPRLTQYWRVAAHDIEPDLRVKVNGRRVYWASRDPLPGGIAFENFELRQRYKAGQKFTFGVTNKEPWDFEPPIPRLQKPPAPQS